MTRAKSICVAMTLLFLVVTIAPVLGQKSETKPEYFIEISSPDKDGLERGKGMAVAGKASIRGGEHLWVFSRRTDFEGVWWPQGEGKIDPETRAWKVAVTFGEAQDIGWDFDLAAMVVNDQEHIKLVRYRTDAMRTGKWLPIEMPETTMPPQYRKVKKISHD